METLVNAETSSEATQPPVTVDDNDVVKESIPKEVPGESSKSLVTGTEEEPLVPIPDWVKEKIPEKYHLDPNLSKYKDLDSFLEGHLNLTKKVGEKFDPPGPESPKEVWDKWYEKMGRPSDPKDYLFNVPEGIQLPTESVDQIKEAFHDLGLNQKQFTGLMEFYTKGLAEQSEAAEAEAARQANEFQAEAVKQLEKEWGNEYETNLKIANQTLDKFGLSDTIIKLGLGNDPAAVKLGYDLAQKTGETLLDTDSAQPTSFAETVRSLKESEPFKNAFHPKHKEVKERIRQLYERQYGS